MSAVQPPSQTSSAHFFSAFLEAINANMKSYPALYGPAGSFTGSGPHETAVCWNVGFQKSCSADYIFLHFIWVLNKL